MSKGLQETAAPVIDTPMTAAAVAVAAAVPAGTSSSAAAAAAAARIAALPAQGSLKMQT
jgi:hypothetical protein